MKSIKIISCTRKIILFLLVVLYIGSYAGARTQKLLVHKVSYASSGEVSRRYFHSITTGDFGIPILTGPGIWRLAGVANIIHSPLRIAETLFWKVYPREYDFNKQRP